MTDHSFRSASTDAPIPADDLDRRLTVAAPDDPGMHRVSVVGDTYTILVSGRQTNGHYCLIDMLVPAGAGPPPHRHDFEEMFTLLDGELEFIFRGAMQTLKAPATVNIPANAPHQFKNKSGRVVHMLCLCAPAGLDEYFMTVGVAVKSRSSPPPKLGNEEQAEKGRLLAELAPKYRIEVLEHA